MVKNTFQNINFSSDKKKVFKQMIDVFFSQDYVAREEREVKAKENYKLSKEDADNQQQNTEPQQRQITDTITRETPKISRNETVFIKEIATGNMMEMKYKKAEDYLKTGKWILN